MSNLLISGTGIRKHRKTSPKRIRKAATKNTTLDEIASCLTTPCACDNLCASFFSLFYVNAARQRFHGLRYEEQNEFLYEVPIFLSLSLLISSHSFLDPYQLLLHGNEHIFLLHSPFNLHYWVLRLLWYF